MVSLVEDDAILRELGRVTVRWSSVEAIMARIISILTANQKIGDDWLGTTESGTARVNSFVAIIGASAISQAERSTLIEAARELAKLLRTRNSLIHSPLLLSYAPENREKFGAGNDVVFIRKDARMKKTHHMTPAIIRQHADNVDLAASPLRNWVFSPERLRGET